MIMAGMARRFWNDEFWMPKGMSFDDIVSTSNAVYAQPRDLYALPVYGFFVFVLRHLYEKYVSNSIARRILASEFEACEKMQVGKKNALSPTGDANGVCTNGFTVNSRYAEKIRKRRSKSRQRLESTMAKIAETSWKSIYHSFSFTYGIIVLYQAPWFWDTRHCWIDFPKHELWPSVYYYYMLEGAYYIALLMCLATDIKRKDRGMMTVHHIATINLIFFSYATNTTRIGTLLMALHRLADMLLQIAKLLLYCKQKTIANFMFIIFVLSFLITRLYIYPFYLVHTMLIKVMWYFQPYPWYYMANVIAMALQVLHILWAYIILKMALKVVTKGPLDKDDRSGSEDESSEEENHATEKKMN